MAASRAKRRKKAQKTQLKPASPRQSRSKQSPPPAQEPPVPTPAAPEEPPPPAHGVTRAIAAAALGVPGIRISQWVADGAPVLWRGARGKAALYDIEALREWREGRDKGLVDSLSLESERAQLERARRLKIEIELREKSGELLERDLVEAESEALLMALKTRLLQIPRQLVQTGIVPREKEAAVIELIHDALRELSDWKWQPPEPVAADDDKDDAA